MTIEITKEEKDEIIKDTLDRLVYCKGYKEELIKLNNKYNPHDDVKYSYGNVNRPEPLFPLHKVLT